SSGQITPSCALLLCLIPSLSFCVFKPHVCLCFYPWFFVDVILPCHLEPPSDAVSEILEWGRPDLDPRFVHVWYEGQNHLVNQNPSYKGRTSLSTDKLKQGDLSLKLTRVKHSDNGRYRCFFPSEHKESIIELLVGKLTFFSTL
uniref:Immunoglobulin V-set domain-containing protein n=1 Tax=Maylandia zebra TaxID=106582 RepID=A0A3P9CJY1_9CICH